MVKAAELFVRALENEGVEYVFGIPGEENLDFLDALARSTIKFILTRHEQAAGFMAATYGRLSGKAGVCLSTLGPGAANLVTSAAYATLGAMPMVIITGQKPLKANMQGRFQLIDVVDMMRPVTKITEQIDAGNRIPSMVRDWFRRAQQERPGAVHLELPEDIAAEETQANIVPRSFFSRPVCDDESIKKAAELILQARRPLLLIGPGASRRSSCDALRQLVDKTGIYFVTTQMGKGVIDERHPRYLGTAALSSGDFVHRAFEAADLIVNVGHDVVEKPPFSMRDDAAYVVHVNYLSAEIDPIYFPQVEVIGDITASVLRLAAAVEQSSNWDFSKFSTIQNKLVENIELALAEKSFPVLPQRLVADVRRSVPDEGVIALDNGIYKIWFARNYPAFARHTVLLDNALASMGAGLPSAIAVALMHPRKNVLAVCGDGGFMMNSAELETAIRYELNLVVLILRDNALGMIKWKQEHMKLQNFGLEFGNPDFVAYAEAYGAKGHRVEKVEDTSALISKAFESGGVHLIEVPVDYSRNDYILNEEIKTLSSAVQI